MRSYLMPLLAGLTMLFAATGGEADEPARITVRADRPGAVISPALYGIFFEEINHAGDGGLYAEMIQNRSFEETVPVEGCTLEGDRCVAPALPDYVTGKIKRWSVPWQFASAWPAWSLDAAGTDAGLSLESDQPLNEHNPHYLRLTVSRLPATASVRLLNEGYWGVAVVQGETYDLSFYARAAQGSLPALRVGLLGANGAELAAAEVQLAGNVQWKKHACSLTPNATDPKARFFLQPLGTGRLDLDMVSLFPRKTFKNRPNGCRPDLAQLLADLKPAFVRFPGGCVVEGATMANRYRWKETIGDVAARPGHWCLWGYRNSDGLGYHEFLQLCEDLGAEAMYVCNCGLACTGRNGDFWPDGRLDELVQDTLDALEYALGSADTPWGAQRARNGHPAPFALKYLEIGNENFGPRYDACYRRFAAAIERRFPQVVLICDTDFAEGRIHDQHFYREPGWFFANFHLYDKRSEPGQPPARVSQSRAGQTEPPKNTAGRKVYVGEYACNRDVGAGNLRAAISEAAFMLGMERNADYVIMASYAPLFYHVEDRRWPVNLIGFDSAASFGRASYYVQQLFAVHRPDVNVACESSAPEMQLPGRRGAIGVGTWGTQAEFKDITVTQNGRTLLAADFGQGLRGWRTLDGDWQAVDGALRQNGDQRPAKALAGDPTWRDYTLTLKARKLAGAEGFLILFQTARDKDRCWWNLGGWGNRQHGLEVPGVSVPRVPGQIETGRWYDIRIECQDSRLRCFLDGQLIHDVSRAGVPSLFAAAGKTNATGEVLLKVVNGANLPQTVQISVAGLPGLASRARTIVLADPDAEAENSVAEPKRIAPRETTTEGVGPQFSHTFPANSVTLMFLRPEAR